MARELSNADLSKVVEAPLDKYTPFAFENSMELLIALDASIQNGTMTPHLWQVEISEFICRPKVFTKRNRLHYVLNAANGSGKDAFVVAPFAIWCCMCVVRSRVIITGADFSQLQAQTEAYIRNLAFTVNEKFGYEVFVVKQGHIYCTATGSEIKIFVTDDGGRAEGYHPWPDSPSQFLAIIVNEAKTVKEVIFKHLRKCTYSVWLQVSSPGQTSGFHYETYRTCILHPEVYVDGKWFARKITAYDCSHIPREILDAEKAYYTEHDPWFKQSRMAEFTSIDEQVVIPFDTVKKCIRLAPEASRNIFVKRGGLDLAAGGDENVFTPLEGNVVERQYAFKTSDPELTVKLCIGFFEKEGFTPGDAKNIFADHGGPIGQAFKMLFDASGWKLTWIYNQAKALHSDKYANRGAEMWFNLARIIGACKLVLKVPHDDKLVTQLANRYYTQSKVNGKIILESKRDAKAQSHGSPDRADSLVLALCGLTLSDFSGVEKAPATANKVVTQQLLVTEMERHRYSEMGFQLGGRPRHKKSGITFNSPHSILHKLYGK